MKKSSSYKQIPYVTRKEPPQRPKLMQLPTARNWKNKVKVYPTTLNISSYTIQDEENENFTLHEAYTNEEDNQPNADYLGSDRHTNELNCSDLSQPFEVQEQFAELTRWSCYPGGEAAQGQGAKVVTCLAFSPDSAFVACGGVSVNGRAPVYVYSLKRQDNAEAGQIFAEFYQKNLISSLSFLPDCNRLVVTDYDGVVAVYDVRRKTGVYFDRNHQSKINCHAVFCEKSTDSAQTCTTLAIGTVDRKVRLYNMEKFENLQCQIQYATEVRALAMTSMDFEENNMKIIVVGGSQNHLSIYKQQAERANQFALVLQIPVEGQTNSMSISGSTVALWKNKQAKQLSRHLSFGGLDKQTTVVVLESGGNTGTLRWEYFGSFAAEAPVASCSLSQDGWRLAIGDDAGHAKIFDVNTGAEVIGYKFTDRIKAVNLSVDGHLLAVGGFDCQLHVSDIRTGFEVFMSLHHKSKRRVQSVSLSQDGSLLALGTHDGFTFAYEMQYHSNNQTERRGSPGSLFENNAMGGSTDAQQQMRESAECLQQIFEHKIEKEVWAVQLSEDGEMIAFGGFDKNAYVFQLRPKNLIFTYSFGWFVSSICLFIPSTKRVPPEFRTSRSFVCPSEINARVESDWQLSSPNAVCVLRGMRRLAVGDWCGVVSVFDIESKEILYSTKLEDRIFSVSFSRCGDFMAVGCRDGKAQVHCISGSERFVLQPENSAPSPKKLAFTARFSAIGLVAEWELDDRVYSVALSPCGRFLAAGGVMKDVHVFDLRTKEQCARLQSTMITNYVTFTLDGRFLAYGGDDKTLHIFSIEPYEEVLQLPQDDTVTSISFSKWGVMALGVGAKLQLYGQGRLHHGVGDEPSFRLAKSLLASPPALEAMLRTHPSVANRVNPISGETLLHAATSMKSEAAVQTILQAKTTIGLTEDTHHLSALGLAALMGYKQIVKLILQGVLDKKFGSQPGSLVPLFRKTSLVEFFPLLLDSDPFSNVLQTSEDSHCNFPNIFPSAASLPVNAPRKRKANSIDEIQPFPKRLMDQLAEKFPDVVVHFLSRFREEEAERLVLGPLATAPIQETVYVACDKRVPMSLWKSYFKEKKLHQESPPPSNWAQNLARALLRIFRRLAGHKPPQKYEVEVKAMRLPLKDFATNLDFYQIIRLVERTNDYVLFEDDTVVTAVLNYKWKTCQQKLKNRALQFLLFLITSTIWLILATKSVKKNMHAPLKGLDGKVAAVMSCLCAAYACFKLLQRLHKHLPWKNRDKRYGRLRKDGRKWVEILSSVGIILSCIAYLCQSPTFTVIGAYAQAFLFLQMLYFLRFNEVCGNTLQVIEQIMVEIVPILSFNLLMLFGFSLAFWIIFSGDQDKDFDPYFKDPAISFLSATFMITGELTPVLSLFRDENKPGAALVEFFIIIVVLVLFNLTIAKMISVYKAAEQKAMLHIRFEKAKIILEIDSENKYLPWLHSLKPVEQYFSES